MDYLQTEVNQFARKHSRSSDPPNQPLSIIINSDDYDSVRASRSWRGAKQIVQIIADTWEKIKELHSEHGLPDYIMYERIAETRQKCIEQLSGKKINNDEAIYLLKHLEKDCSHFKQFMLYMLFDPQLTAFYDVLNENHETLSEVVEDPFGDVCIYGYHYKKIQK